MNATDIAELRSALLRALVTAGAARAMAERLGVGEISLDATQAQGALAAADGRLNAISVAFFNQKKLNV